MGMFRSGTCFPAGSNGEENQKNLSSSTIQILYSEVYQITDTLTTVEKSIGKLSQGCMSYKTGCAVVLNLDKWADYPMFHRLDILKPCCLSQGNGSGILHDS